MGLASAPRWAGGARRLATVWFSDIVGSTEIATELGDRRFRLIVAQYLAAARAALRRYGGREIDTAGDGMLATFDTPAAALRAALELAETVREFGVEVRSGVHLGEVEQDADGRVGGITVHLGARVASLAGAGEILTTRATSELAAGGGFHFEHRGMHALKGIPGEHSIVALVGSEDLTLDAPLPADEAARRRAVSTSPARVPGADRPTGASQAHPFVGRLRELGDLHAALADAVEGHGSLFLISGEPGIGKTRLMATVAARAEAQGWVVLVGRCWEGGGAPAYWPWIQLLREAGEDLSRFATSEGTAGHDEGGADPGDPEAARFQLFDGVGRYLAGLAAERPCLVMLEDLHAADEPSLLLLRFVASSIREHPLVVLASYREGDARVRELGELFAHVARLGSRIRLGGLNPEEVTTYITLSAGEQPSAALAARVGDVTAGNPFFLGEIVRELAARGSLEAVDERGVLPLPEEVRALIRRRLAGLSARTTQLLRVAAVIGRDFDRRVISAASTPDPRQVGDSLAEAERAGVIVGRDGAGTYTFTHDLLRETLYDDLPEAERLELHRSLGTAFQDLFRDDLEPHLAEIAHHLAVAAPLGESERAVEFSVRAGDRSLGVFAYEDAARQYERAVELLGHAPPSERRARIHLKLGDALSRAGNAEAARASFERAAAIAERASEAETFALSALGYGAAEKVRAAYGGLALTVRMQSATTGIAMLEEALAALPSDDGPLRARTLAMLATELYWQAAAPAAAGRPAEARDRYVELSREALDMARRLDDPAVLVEALYARHWALLAPDTLRERLDNAQEMLVAAAVAGNDEFAFLARHARAHGFLEGCDVASMDAEIEAMDRLARRTRQRLHAWHVSTLHVMRTLLEGHAAEAERQARETVEASGLADNTYVDYMFEHAQLFAIRWAQGRLGDIGDRIEEHGARFAGFARWRDALAAAELGDEVGARAELERFARSDFSVMPRTGLWILHACALAEAAVLLRDERRAAALYELLGPYADRNAISVSTLPFGPVATRLGMLATLLGRWEEAERHLRRAGNLCDAMGARAIGARVLVEWARMFRARRDRRDGDRAAEVLSRAGALCEELELPGIAVRVAALSRADGGS